MLRTRIDFGWAALKHEPDFNLVPMLVRLSES